MLSASHAEYALCLHIVFVTKHRRQTLTELLAALQEAFAHILADWRCTLIEFGGEADHVHWLVGIRPALNLSVLINNLKSASARRMRHRFADHLRPFYWQPYFWHRAYSVGSIGQASLATVQRYVEAQGTKKSPARRPEGHRLLGPSWLSLK